MRIASKGIDVEGELAIITANSPFLILSPYKDFPKIRFYTWNKNEKNITIDLHFVPLSLISKKFFNSYLFQNEIFYFEGK